MTFEEELRAVLPVDIAHRERLIEISALHLERIVETNRSFNLTRIVSPREAAIKHVLDSVLPWRHFQSAGHVLDAGTGAGFPGIPLSVIFPDVRFTLTESVGKKARFVDETAAALHLSNVAAVNARAEDALRSMPGALITGRAVAPIAKACALFAAAIKEGSRALLYKGPDAESEMAEAAGQARQFRLALRVVDRYELPEGMGTRTLVEMRRADN